MQRLNPQKFPEEKSKRHHPTTIATGPSAIPARDEFSNIAGHSPQVRHLHQLKSISNTRLERGMSSNTGEMGLPDRLRTGVESLSGVSMSEVRVHYNSEKPAQLQAHAFAHGHDIHMAPGQEHHLPHEAWHVVQQAQGRVKPTLQMKGISINDESHLEREADVMGARAMAGGFASRQVAPSGMITPVIQGVFTIKKGDTYDAADKVTAKTAYIKTALRNSDSKPKASPDDLIEELKLMASESGDLGKFSWLEALAQADARISAKSGATTAALKPTVLTYDSDDEADMEVDAFGTLRRTVSKGVWAEIPSTTTTSSDYRDSKHKVQMPSGYTFSKMANNNFVTGKGFSGKQSGYDDIISTLNANHGMSEKDIASLMMLGLFDHPKFMATVAAYAEEKQQNRVQFLLALLVNEILGRSAANLIEITLILSKASTDGKLLERFKVRGIFYPNAKQHNGIGGQKLSRLGTSAVDTDDLDSDLEEVVDSNTAMVQSLMSKLGVTNETALNAKLQSIFASFADTLKSFNIS